MGGPYGGSSVTKKICGFRAGACNKAGHASTWEEEVRERDGAAHKEVCGETETGSERHFSVRWRWISQLFFCSRTRSITSFCTHSATQPRKQGHPRVRSRPALRRATNVTRDVSGRKRIGLVFFARWCWLTWQREGARRGTAAALHCVFLSIFCTGHNFRFSLVQAWKRWTALEGDQRRDARRRVREGVLEGVWEGVWEGAAEGVAAAVRAAAARGRATVKPSTRGGALAALTDRNKPISITMLSVQAEATKVLWLEPVFRLPKRKTRVHLLGAAAQARPKAIRNMESILSSLLRATPLAPAPAQSTSSTDVKGKQIEWSLESDDEEDEDFDDGDAGSSRSTKRARISEVIEEETAAADPQQSATPNPDISALIHALNASKTPEAMRVTMDMMNQLRFFSTTNSATNNAGSSSTANVALSTVSPTNPRKSRDKHDKGFRGIALSLQRKMRRLQIPAPPGQIAPKTPASPLTEFLVSSPPNSSSISAPAPTQQAPTSIVEDLASDAILFFGSTSTTTSSAWRQSPRFQGGIMNISLSFEANPPSARVLDGDYSPPCAPELVLHLVGLYFAHVHPYFPMVHKVRFFEQLREKRTDHFNLLVNSMCALMSQQCRDLTAWGVANPVELHMAFFERARVLLGHQFDWPHINNVQALLLLCMVGQGTNINATSYHYIGIAHRLAVELGMHRNLDNLKHASLDPELLECMRTTWFCLYVLDRYTSVVEGRPTAISDEEWDTPFPSSDTPEITHLRHHVGLCELLGRIGNFVNRPSRPGTAHRPHIFPHLASTPPPARDAQCEITTMTANLAAWHAALPPTLAARPPEGSAWSLHHHLHAMFHTASVLLRRLDVSRFDQTCALHACEIGRVLQCLPQHGGVVRGSFVFVLPLVVYSALTASTLFLDLALAAKPLDPKRRRTSSSSGRAAAALAGKVTPDTARMAARELKKSLGAFERLKTTSLFANYYGQLIVEVLRNDAVVLPEDEEDAEDESPSPAGAVQTPRGATTAGLFSFFGGGDGQGQSQQYQHTAGASLTSRIASSMAAVVEGAKWNEFLHFSPKLGQQTMAPATSSATVGSSSSFMSAASQMAPVSFMNAASQMAPTSLINAASQMAPTSLINAASQMAPASLLNAASTMWGRFAAGQVMDQQHPPPPAPMVGHLGPTSPLGRSVLAAEDVQAGMQEGEDGSPGGGHRSPYFNDIFADLLHGSPENSGGVGGEWPEMSLNDLERRPSEPPEDYGQHFQQFQYGSSGMRG